MLPGVTLTLTDPGADTWTVSVNYGDGTFIVKSAGSLRSFVTEAHQYPAGGATYTVSISVSDDEGTAGSTSFPVDTRFSTQTVLLPSLTTSRLGQVVRYSCPAAPGAKDWQPAAYSPRTGLVYIPHQNICMDVEGLEANYIAGTPYVGANVKMYAGPGEHRGEFAAWDPVAARKVWSIEEDLPVRPLEVE